MRKRHIDVISMGCSKNLIDSERLMRRLEAKGYDVSHDSEKPCGEYVVVNTCGFINDAKEESIDMIFNLVKLKQQRRIGTLAVMGCLSQRYMEELKEEMPEVDRWYGKFDWNGFIESLPDLNDETKPREWERSLTTPPHSCYIKISEGCNRHCAFCAIPIITGRHTSRPIDEILEETEELAAKGVKEFNVIAQDLSSYGTDLYGKSRLAELVDRMADIKGVEWIRLHYAYPADFPMDVLDVMAKRDNVCKYLDIALQHASDKVLSRMRRRIDRRHTEELIEKIREKVPGIKLRTTMMVGFPGEGEEEFEELLEFVRKWRFERLGAFAYSMEDDTYAARHYADEVDEATKQRRLDQLMEIQEQISLEENEKMTGKRLKVLIDRLQPDGTAIGRTQWDSPEVDHEVMVKGEGLKPGDFAEVTVTGTYPFELEAEL